MSKEINYEKDVSIDEDALDVECAEQARLMLKYTRNSAQMRRDVDEAKQNLDITKAEVDRSIREHPEKFKIEKVTEGSVSSAILTEPKYQKAYQEYLDVKYEMDMSTGAVAAFSQRKDMLEALVKLHGQQYFAGPKVPRDLSYEMQKRRKQSETNANIKLGITRSK